MPHMVLTTEVDANCERCEELLGKALEKVELLSTRVDELQARGSELENERRAWKLRAETATAFLKDVLVDLPLAMRLIKAGAPMATSLETLLKRIKDESQRSDMLAKDAWTQTTQVAKEFVKEVELLSCSYQDGFVDHWADRFRKILGT